MVLTACSGTATPEPAPVEAPVSLGWASRIVARPADFEALMQATGRPPWIALHANDHRAALAAFAPDSQAGAVGQARAHLAEILIQQDLARLEDRVTATLFSGLEARSPLASGDPVLHAAVAAAHCHGRDPGALADRVDDAVGPALDDWPTSPIDEVPAGSSPWHQRARQHLAAVQGAALSPDPGAALRQAAAHPVTSRARAGVQDPVPDPCLHATLSRAGVIGLDPGQAVPLAEGWSEPELAGVLFAPWPTEDDLRHEAGVDRDLALVGDAPPSLSTWELPVSDEDSAGAAQAYVRALDARLDGLRRHLAEVADPDGQALLAQVDPLHRWRQEHLVVRARVHLRADRPHRARTLLLLARDVSERGIGPRNSPALLALLAEANLRTGRTREALDALLVLSRALPEVRGLQELVGDLAVLEGMDRQGDSKEH